ncbi:helix-turn-helix domain-containing protein [Aquimarina pacifica]|uniref:helix-turn-helix domain-containing protein n=1 Tax=Aquimarina pacifica TaxID=1296415 RepID=UPI000470CC74|nr:helix-turn-helix domain-containing protein [Aquimarina pacifica]
MGLIQKIVTSIPVLSILFLFFYPSIVYGNNDELYIRNQDIDTYNSISQKEENEHIKEVGFIDSKNTIQKYPKSAVVDSTFIFRKLALMHAKERKASLACAFAEKYVKSSLDITFVDHSYFDEISGSKPYRALASKYLKKFSMWAVFCFYVAFIGIFIAVVLNFRKRADKVANFIMSAFVLLHSFFIIHIGLYLMNYGYYFPHTYYMSTVFSFLYGPLVYFYFKRVTAQYCFKYSDLWHLFPTALLAFLLVPIYLLSAEEKLRILINGDRPYITLIMLSKLASLLVYGIFVIRMYLKYTKNTIFRSKLKHNWQRNIVIFCSVYVISYAIYTVLIMQQVFSGFLFYTQVVSMSLLVLYVGYMAFVQPSLFGNLKVIDFESKSKEAKYEKSGLTQSLSLELKIKLLYLLNEKKIYKQNDITLQRLSEMLETTRHNTSQIINEHFNLNFFELINKYRIDEAKEILKGEKYKGFNIIDVAYEVGFNNKVTFNKSFKKYNQITPSQYLKLYVA